MSAKKERSGAEPVAWAALREDGDIAWIGYTPDGAADGAGGRQIVPLYRAPALTDAERDCLEWAEEIAGNCEEFDRVGVLRGMLERLGHKEGGQHERRE